MKGGAWVNALSGKVSKRDHRMGNGGGCLLRQHPILRSIPLVGLGTLRYHPRQRPANMLSSSVCTVSRPRRWHRLVIAGPGILKECLGAMDGRLRPGRELHSLSTRDYGKGGRVRATGLFGKLCQRETASLQLRIVSRGPRTCL